MFDFCVTVEVGSFNVVRLVTTPLSSLLSGCYQSEIMYDKKSNGNKYKKQIEEVSRTRGWRCKKSTQTRVVGKVTDKVHP